MNYKKYRPIQQEEQDVPRVYMMLQVKRQTKGINGGDDQSEV